MALNWRNFTKCNNEFGPIWSGNSRLMWKFLPTGVVPMPNSEAIPMWQNNIQNMLTSTRDYNTKIQILISAISDAQEEPAEEQAKNPFFNPNIKETHPDQFYICLAQ